MRKAVFDCAQELVLLRHAERDGAEYTLAYLTLLNLAAATTSGQEAASVQFVLFRSNPELPEPKLLVRSRFHPLSA